MRRAYLLELTVFRDYGIQLLGLGLLVSFFCGVGMKSTLVIPAILTCMFFMMGAMGAAAYDEQNNWQRFRLTMPLSRFDIVCGRYAAIVTLGLGAAALGLLVVFALNELAGFLNIPEHIARYITIEGDTYSALVASTAACIFLGSVVTTVVTPVYFAFGQTKATQILPTLTVLIFVVPVTIFTNSGVLDLGIPALQFVNDALSYISTPSGLAMGCLVLLLVSAAILYISALLSLKLYQHREL